YVRRRITSGSASFMGWVLQKSLTSGFMPPANTYESFGFSIALDADILIVGGAHPSLGVMLFKRTGENWIHTQSLVPNEGMSSPLAANFGCSVGISRDRLIIGAAGASSGSNQDVGAAYIFEPVNGVWIQKQRLEPDQPLVQLHFGQQVDISGDLAVIGTPL